MRKDKNGYKVKWEEARSLWVGGRMGIVGRARAGPRRMAHFGLVNGASPELEPPARLSAMTGPWCE